MTVIVEFEIDEQKLGGFTAEGYVEEKLKTTGLKYAPIKVLVESRVVPELPE